MVGWRLIDLKGYVYRAGGLAVSPPFRVMPPSSGKRGAKGAVRDVVDNLGKYDFVFRSDVKAYYASIDHVILMDMLWDLITDRCLLRLIYSFLQHSICDGGYYWDVAKGLSRGCPLSPLLGAVYLKKLDDRMDKSGLFYVRFMDD